MIQNLHLYVHCPFNCVYTSICPAGGIQRAFENHSSEESRSTFSHSPHVLLATGCCQCVIKICGGWGTLNGEKREDYTKEKRERVPEQIRNTSRSSSHWLSQSKYLLQYTANVSLSLCISRSSHILFNSRSQHLYRHAAVDSQRSTAVL